MSRKKRLKTAVFVGSSKLTTIKRAHRRVESEILLCPLFFGKTLIYKGKKLW